MNELQRSVMENRQIRIEMNVVEVGPQSVAMSDRRYRCLVTLIRTNRPRMWTFRCMNCGSKLGELMNREVLTISDFYDPQNIENGGYGRHCKGTMPDGLPCQYSYFFQLG